jgi:hypothetical protein
MSPKLTNLSLYVRGAFAPLRCGANSQMRGIGRTIVIPMLMVAVSIALAAFGIALAQAHSNPWLLEWIPAYCCVTNDCCWEVSERELAPLPDDKWTVVATGQVRPRTDWSPDGKFYRCACDYDAEAGKWIRHIGANTRCVFVPWRAVGIPMRTLRLLAAAPA